MLEYEGLVNTIIAANQQVLRKFDNSINNQSRAEVAKDICKQITECILSEHRMQVMEETHPAIKELREKLNMMTALTNDSQK